MKYDIKKLIKFLFEKTLFEIDIESDKNFVVDYINQIHNSRLGEEYCFIIKDNNSFDFLEIYIWSEYSWTELLDDYNILSLTMRNITYLKHYKLNNNILKV